ncbi:MAG: hypothetical protein WCV90_04205 [Candidatus Woesearchaeota archaeon]|jgi:hypothetical protein
MSNLTTSEIEQIITDHPEAIVRYVSPDHQGFRNENPYCAGLIFKGDLYLVFEGKNPTLPPYLVIESETRAGGRPGRKDRYWGISGLEVATNSTEPDLRLAEIALNALKINKAPEEYWVYVMESIKGFGKRRRIE